MINTSFNYLYTSVSISFPLKNKNLTKSYLKPLTPSLTFNYLSTFYWYVPIPLHSIATNFKVYGFANKLLIREEIKLSLLQIIFIFKPT